MDTKTPNIEIIRSVAACDPRFRRITKDGHFVFADSETNAEFTMTPDEYVAEHPVSTIEELYATLDLAIQRIANTNINQSAEMVDTLLDLRVLITRFADEENAAKQQFFQLWRGAAGLTEEPS